MFETLSHLNPRLQELVRDVEEEEVGLRVVSAEIYSLPYLDLEASIEVCEAQPFNILEEFILRAAHTLQPPPTRDGLAQMMGIDRLFLDASWQKLTKLKAIDTANGDTLSLTKEGRDYYLQGQLPPASHLEILHFRYQPITDQLTVADSGIEESESAPLLPGYLVGQEPPPEELASGVMGDLSRVIAVTQRAGLDLHAPQDGQVINAVKGWSIANQGQTSRAILVVQDTIAPVESQDNVSLRVVTVNAGRRDFGLEEKLHVWMDEGRMTLAQLVLSSVEVTIEPEEAEDQIAQPVLARPAIVHYRSQMATLRSQPARQQSPPTVEDRERIGVQLLRDEEIRPSFLAALREAHHTVLICSPWINDQVVDDEFIGILEDLAQRQVITLIGWGIARTREKQTQRPPESLLKRLHQIKTPEECPAVIVHWVGNQHSKDVLVDYRLHMSGSHNWLSYRGDRCPRGETTYRVTEPTCVESALKYMDKMFAKAVDERWQALINRQGKQLHRGGAANTLAELEQCCVTSVVARQAKMAIRRVRHLPNADDRTPLRALRLMSTIDLALLRLPDDVLTKMITVLELEEAAEQLRRDASALLARAAVSESEHFEEIWLRLKARFSSAEQPVGV